MCVLRMTWDIITKKVLDINKKEPPPQVEDKCVDGNELENMSHGKKRNIGKKMQSWNIEGKRRCWVDSQGLFSYKSQKFFSSPSHPEQLYSSSVNCLMSSEDIFHAVKTCKSWYTEIGNWWNLYYSHTPFRYCHKDREDCAFF